MKNSMRGFTLVEVMIAAAIVAILAAVAIPSYQNSLTKTRRADAQSALMGLAQAMERHYTAQNTYQGAAASGNDTGAPAVFPTQSPLDGSTKYYNLSITAADGESFTVRATPITGTSQASDGNLELDSTGAKRWKGTSGWE